MKLMKILLCITLTSLFTLPAFADDTSQQNMGSGRMSAGGGVQPADQYEDGNCKGVDCPDEGVEEDNAATDIPDDNTNMDNGTY